METNIRVASVEDAQVLATLHKNNLPSDPASFLGASFLAQRLYPRILTLAMAAFIAEDESGEAVGYIACGRPTQLIRVLGITELLKIATQADARKAALSVLRLLLRYPSGLPDCELQWIAVSVNIRSQHLGTRLVQAALQDLHLRGVPRVWVKTLENTPGNIAFYESLGFKVTHRVAGRVFLERTTELSQEEGWCRNE